MVSDNPLPWLFDVLIIYLWLPAPPRPLMSRAQILHPSLPLSARGPLSLCYPGLPRHLALRLWRCCLVQWLRAPVRVREARGEAGCRHPPSPYPGLPQTRPAQRPPLGRNKWQYLLTLQLNRYFWLLALRGQHVTGWILYGAPTAPWGEARSG